MKAGWQTKKLQDVVDSSCSLSYGIVQPGEDFQDGLPIVRPVDLTSKFIALSGLKRINPIFAESYKRTNLSGNEILMCVRGNTGVVSIASQELNGANVTRGIVPIRFDSKKVNHIFGFYILCSDYVQKQIKEKTYGAALMQINIRDLKNININFPEEKEQRRIVAILDEAFAGIAAAKKNAEQNLKNAKEVFASAINSIEGKKVNLGDYVEIKTGKLDANAAEENGKYPFFTCSREIFSINNFSFDCEAILLAGNNAVGDFNVKYFNGKFNAYQITYVITANKRRQILCKYLYIQLLNSLKKFKEKSVGAATKFLKLGMIKEMQIILPSLLEQETIISNLSCIQERTEKLESIYQQKLSNLEELKKSLLQQAFSGAL